MPDIRPMNYRDCVRNLIERMPVPVFDIVLSEESFPPTGTKLNNEKSLALYLAPDRNENLNAALMQQIFPSALMGHIFVFSSVMMFEVVGYTLGGAIYTFLNRNFGVKNDFFDATLGPGTSLAISFRWAKNLILSIVAFILLWLVLSPQESLEKLDEISLNSFKEFMINENLPLAIFRQFVTDAIFGFIGWTIFWMLARSMNNVSANPVIFWLRAFALQDPEGNSRNLPDSETSILEGYHAMLKRIKDL